MSLELCILASGSAGNAALVRSPTGILLIDAGIGPRSLSKRLDGTGVRLHDITALCLTHLDGDHFSPRWTSTLLSLNIAVHCHVNKVAALALSCPELMPLVRAFDGLPFSPVDGLTCDPIHCAHDILGSHGFVIYGFGYRIGYATDVVFKAPHYRWARSCACDPPSAALSGWTRRDSAAAAAWRQ